jgi:predicted transcriptional regulator
MSKDASLTVRVRQDTSERLDLLSKAMNRSKSYVIEQALDQYLALNEWQIQGIQAAIDDVDNGAGALTDHSEVRTKWEARIAHKMD